MKRFSGCLLVAIVGCGSLPDQGNGVVGLEIVGPAADSLAVGKSLMLQARALDIQGNPVAATQVFWRTLDTALVTLDTVTGTVTALANTGTARIQARVGTLLSNFIPITLIDSTSSVRGGP